MRLDFFHLVLYGTDLLLFGAYFLMMTVVSHLKNIGALQRIGYFLEYAIYSAVMIQLGHLIIQGIQDNRGNSIVLQWIGVAFAEAMVSLFLLRKFPASASREFCMEKALQEQCMPASGMYVGGLFLLWLLTILFWLFVPDVPSPFLLLPFMGILAVLLLFSMLWRCQFEGSMLRLERESHARQVQKEADYMQSVDEQYQRTRELWHDLKNHIGVLQILVQKQKYQEMEEYLSSFQKDVEQRMIPYQTGNSAVDALLSDKLYQMQKKGISVSMKLCPLAAMRIPSRDLCTILGNLLDNAQEACEPFVCQDGEGYVNVVLKQQDNFFYLNISNPAKESDEKNMFVSKKTGMDNVVGHGLGLRSVERIVHQYSGFMTTQYQDGQFVVCLRLENKNMEF